MRVLVTGGAGYIGNEVCRECVRKGWTPVVLDVLLWGDDALSDIRDKVEIIDGDCRSSKDMLKALRGVDAVIHLAGIVGEYACNMNHRAHFSTNIESTRTLINCCTDPEVDLIRDVIYLSSCSVYGNVRGLYDEVSETTPVSPLSSYAEAKVVSEKLLLDRAREVSHFHPTILRLTTVFGWSPRPRLDLVTNLFVFNAWKNKKITVFGDGMQYRSLIHVNDVARAVVEVLEKPRFIRKCRTFHVGEENNNISVRELAELVQSKVPGTEIDFVEGATSDRRDYRINCKPFQNAVGWSARYSVEDGIVEILERLDSLDWDWESARFRNNAIEYE